MGSASLVTYKNVVTGAEAPPSGTGLLLELHPGGSCVRAGVLQNSLYACTSYIFTFSDDCSWTFDGATLSLDVGPGAMRSKLCGGEVKEGESKATSDTFTVKRATEGGFEWLSLTDASGSELRLRRE